MRTISDIRYGEHDKALLDLHLPEKNEFPVFIYFHGGGIEAGDKSVEKSLHKTLTENGVAIVTANYRLYPNAKYPDFIRDCAAVCDWVKKHINEYGNATKIYVGGSSAGGYLSMMLCFDDRWLGEFGLSSNDFDGFVLDAGQPTSHFNVLREKGIDTRRVIVDETAPLYHVCGDGKYPDMLIIVSDDDMQNRYEQTVLLTSTLKHFGHQNYKLELMHGKHCQYVMTNDGNGVNIFGKLILDFIN